MLTEHEEKLIQRYYIYPKIAITAVIMALALGVPFILLEMIDDLVFHDEEVIFWGLYVYLGFAALYLILFCYCTLRAKLGMRKEEWQELQRRLKVRQQQSDYSAAAAGAMAMGAAGRLMQKSQNKTVRGAGTAAQVAGAVGAVATAGAMSAEIAHNAQAMAEAYGVPLPRTKGLRTVLVLLPLVILIGTYIPQYSHAHTAMQQNKLLLRLGDSGFLFIEDSFLFALIIFDIGGCTMIQLREKELPSLEFYNQAVAVKQVTERYHIPLIESRS